MKCEYYKASAQIIAGYECSKLDVKLPFSALSDILVMTLVGQLCALSRVGLPDGWRLGSTTIVFTQVNHKEMDEIAL